MRDANVITSRAGERGAGLSAAAGDQGRGRRSSRRTSSSGSASSSTTSSASSSTSRGSRSTRRSISTCSRRPSARSERQLRAIEGGPVRHVSAHELREVSWPRPNDDESANGAELAVSAGGVHRDGSAHRRHSRTRRRPRLRRQQVQSRRAGRSPARVDVQADRLRRRRPERAAAVVPARRLAAHRAAWATIPRGRRRTSRATSWARSRCGRRSISRATSRRSGWAWSSARRA